MTLGVGAGQMSRVDSSRIASIKAEAAGLSLAGSAVASDAFFPFRDGLDVVIDAGASCVIQPGGSMRDDRSDRRRRRARRRHGPDGHPPLPPLKLPEVAGLALAFIARLITGAQGHWYGAPPKAEQRIYFANHQSHFDWVLIWAALPRDLRATTRPIAARDYWTSTPLKHWITREIFNAVYVSRERKDDEDPLEPLLEALRHGDSLVIFPEGTRGHAADPAPFKSGLYALGRGLSGGAADPGLDRQRAARHAQGRSRAGADPVHGDLRRAAGARAGRRAARLPRSRPRRGDRLARGRLMGLRELSVSQQVGLLFVGLFGAAGPGDAAGLRRLAARGEPASSKHASANASPRDLRAVWIGARAVLGLLGGRPVRLDPAVRPGLVPRPARVRDADAHPARRPPQPAAGVLRRPAGAVRARRHAPLQRLHRLHPGLRLLRHSGASARSPTTRCAFSSAPRRSSGASRSASTA